MTAGLFILTHLVTRQAGDSYIDSSKKLVAARYADLFESLDLPQDNSHENAEYCANYQESI
ncbi:hypothetical protein [Vagococcus penaei]|uniref:hypothetical protein n=1 Tax=Vagococcus penaei TaxID=633807 RepID=UPI0011D13CAD|nr:hypothetical protein [Vagococcus penaei]